MRAQRLTRLLATPCVLPQIHPPLPTPHPETPFLRSGPATGSGGEPKYLDHLPLERQSRILERHGLRVTSQALWDQIDALAKHLEPSYQALLPRVLAAPLVGADETRWQLMERGSGSSRWWVWCVASPEAVVYRLCGTRSTKEARALLAGYRGIVMCDGYGVYEALEHGYKQLAEVERSFRTLKSTLDLRPLYHRLPERIEAHVLLCWLALLLVRLVETETGEGWELVRDEIDQIHRVDLRTKDGDSQVVTKLNDRQRKLLKSLELTPPKAVSTAHLRAEAA